MTVRVVQSGNHRAAAGVDHLRRWSAERECFRIGADHDEAIAADRDGLRLRARVVDRVDTRVDDDEIGRLPALAVSAA